MKQISQELQEITAAVHYRPSVSIIMPFEPKMNLKSELVRSLKSAVARVEEKLQENYPSDSGQAVMDRLRRIISELNLNTHKKSIAIYVSPVFEKVLYLDIAVEERVLVDESFEIRDLVYAKKQLHKYLVLLLSFKHSQMYLGNSGNLTRIISNHAESIDPYINDIAERVANFSDVSDRKEVLMDKFLHHVDQNLGMVLNAYPLPVFVMATKKIAGHFNKLTHHGTSVVQYIHGNYEEVSADHLGNVLEPYIRNWREVAHKDLLNQLDDAFGKGKLAVGMKNVWREAMHNKGRMLVVEKDFTYPALRKSKDEIVQATGEANDRFSIIHDAVDQVIEAVLRNGGDVEFVEQGTLSDYSRIALIQYY